MYTLSGTFGTSVFYQAALEKAQESPVCAKYADLVHRQRLFSIFELKEVNNSLTMPAQSSRKSEYKCYWNTCTTEAQTITLN